MGRVVIGKLMTRYEDQRTNLEDFHINQNIRQHSWNKWWQKFHIQYLFRTDEVDIYDFVLNTKSLEKGACPFSYCYILFCSFLMRDKSFKGKWRHCQFYACFFLYVCNESSLNASCIMKKSVLPNNTKEYIGVWSNINRHVRVVSILCP
jgi:hypothetical protein